MAKDDNRTRTRRLRFPEFQRDTLRDVELADVTSECITRNGGALPTNSVMGVTKTEGIVPMQTRLIASDIARYKLVRKDWFAYNPMRLNIGSIARWQGERDILVSPDYVVFKCLDEGDTGILPAYLDHFRQSSAWEDFVREGGDGGVRVRIYYKDISHFQLALPSLAEQKKIAECLTSRDELIAAQGRKVDTLKAHKKGLMQQLLRRDLPMVELGKLAELKLGKMLNRDKHLTGTLLPYVGVLSLRWNSVDTSNLPQMYFEDDELDRFGLRAGDVIVCEGGTEPGRSAVWDGRLPDLKFQKAVHRVRFNVPFEPRLLVAYLESIAGTPALESHFTGTGIQHLTRETFAKLKIPYFPIKDQRAIAAGFGALDELMAAETSKLSSLKTHKQGLMQQLFPSRDSGL